jgi:hypothetical protein
VGLTAFPLFVSGLNFTNATSVILPPPATGFGDQPGPRQLNSQEPRTPVAIFSRDLEVPTLQFFGELDENLQQEENTPEEGPSGPDWLPAPWDFDEPLAAQAGGLLGVSLPDEAVDQGIRRFLESIEDVGLTLAREAGQRGLLPWGAATGMLAAAALQAARPRRRADERLADAVPARGTWYNPGTSYCPKRCLDAEPR